MKKIILILSILSLTGCVNNQWKVPEQTDKDTIIIIEYTF
jgi:hypothetical protein